MKRIISFILAFVLVLGMLPMGAVRASAAVTKTSDKAIEFIKDDELIEVTPKSIRLRKKILNTELRMKEMMRIRRALQGNK